MKMPGVKHRSFTSYNLVDIHNYTEEELWEQKNFLSKILLLEKAKQKNEIKGYLQRIEQEVDLNEEELNILIKMIYGSVHRKIGTKDMKQFIENMKNRKGGNTMLTALEEYFDNMIEEKIK